MFALRKYLFIGAFVFLVIIFFFKKDLPLIIADASGLIASILLFLIVLLELIARRKNER